MKLQVKRGATSFVCHIFIQNSSSTTGAGLTGLTNASGSLTCYYMRAGATAAVSSTLNNITTLGTYAGSATNTGFKEVDATNMPGLYELQPANNALASGANQVIFMLKGATNMAPALLELQLQDLDPNDPVRAGLTALPNAAAEAAGGLYTRGSGAGQINQPANGQIDANAVKVDGVALTSHASGKFPADVLTIAGTTQTARDIGASVLLSAGTGTGQLDFTAGVVKANATQILGGTIPAPTVTGVPNVNVKTWNDLTTVALPLIPTTAGRTLDVSATGEAGVDWANVGSPTTTVGLTGTTISTSQVVASVTGAVGSVTGAVGSVTAAVSLTAAESQIVRSNTATAGTSTTLTFDGSASAINDYYKGMLLVWTSGANIAVSRIITGYVGATKVATFAVALPSAADATPTFTVRNTRTAFPGTDGKTLISTDAQDLSASLDVNTKKVAGGTIPSGVLPNAVAGAAGGVFIAGTNAATTVTTALTTTFTGNLTGSVGSVTGAVGSVTGAVGSVTGNVGGNVIGSVGSVATGGIAAASFVAGAIDATAIAADAIGSSELATTAVNEIRDAILSDSTPFAGASIAAIKTKTDFLPSATAGATGGLFIAGTNAATTVTTSLTTTFTGNLTGSVGSVTGSVGSVTGNVGGNVTGSVGSVTGAVGSVTGNVGGNVTGSVGSVAAGGITAASVATGAIDADALATDAVAEIADGVWDEAITGHLTAGSTGAALNAAGSAGDPWSTPLPGAYGAGTAGKIVGTNLDTTVSSRLAAASYTTPPTAGTNAAAVWDEARAGHVAAGSFGQGVASVQGNVTGSVASVTGAVGSVTGNIGGNVTGSVGSVTGAVGSVTGNVGGNVTGTIGGLTAAALKDFFDTDSTTTYGSAVAGSVVKEIADNSGGATPPTAAVIAGAVWDEARAGHVAAGSFGQGVASVQGNVTGSVASVTGAVGSVTGNIGGNVTGSVASVTGAVGSVTGNVGGNVVGSVASVTADVGITQAGADKVWLTASRTLTSFGTLVADLTTAVWGAATRTLTSFGFTVTTTDSANITAIKAKTDNLPAIPAASGDAMALTSVERNAVADALLDRADAIYTGITPRKAIRTTLDGAATGQTSGGGTTTFLVKSQDGTKTRVTATVDVDGNRSAITVGDLT